MYCKNLNSLIMCRHIKKVGNHCPIRFTSVSTVVPGEKILRGNRVLLKFSRQLPESYFCNIEKNMTKC